MDSQGPTDGGIVQTGSPADWSAASQGKGRQGFNSCRQLSPSMQIWKWKVMCLEHEAVVEEEIQLAALARRVQRRGTDAGEFEQA